MGKATFLSLRDRDGDLQAFVKKDKVGDEAYETLKLLDLGDIAWVKGRAMRTRAGELSVEAGEGGFRLLTKALRPLPEKWHGLHDVETRYRQRYVDLSVNPEVREAFRRRTKLITALRRFLDEREFVEVETPILHTPEQAGGAAARTFQTHHNALDIPLKLRIATELHLKRLIVGGLERVYEIARCYRNEGVSTRHNPEFTMLEFYQAYATYLDLLDFTEEMVSRLCMGGDGDRGGAVPGSDDRLSAAVAPGVDARRGGEALWNRRERFGEARPAGEDDEGRSGRPHDREGGALQARQDGVRGGTDRLGFRDVL
jgi:lysyl-tRNA synthetase class 2